MSYASWFLAHGKKHKAIVEKISNLSDNEIIEYFRYENMIKKELNFCPLYKDAKKCHEIENLNCYLCACPNFRFDDKGFKELEKKTLFSYCEIDSKNGAEFRRDNAIHQDCSGCFVPHNEAYIKKIFSRDWFKIMRGTFH